MSCERVLLQASGSSYILKYSIRTFSEQEAKKSITPLLILLNGCLIERVFPDIAILMASDGLHL